ncbi:LysM peptidoglycan-binding domain-containing protein [Carnobacterium sp. FSL E2-0243]|uniref:LysM peptidoglycan-binding domain-containing protein n=1 Tax=Carnobacterium sp. FSL E2-0243 TaxID=2921365 RepID=UPI0030FB9F3E
MKKRIDYRRSLEINKKRKRMAKLGILSAFGMIGLMSATPAFASEWSANAPESISIEQGATSHTMKQGDILWAIVMKINVNVNTLASINNINLSNGEQFTMPVGTVIHFSESEIKAVNSNGQAINNGVKVNDSNKIVANKPIGTDISKDVADGKASNIDIVGTPDNTGKLPAPNTGGNTDPSNPVTPEVPVEPEIPVIPPVIDPENPIEPEKPIEPSTPTNKDVYVTVNVDENGSVLDSTSGYEFVSEATDKKVDTLENGNTVTTYTTTKTWKESSNPTDPTNENKYVIINVDTNGNVLNSVEGYSFVSEATQSGVETLPNGNTVTTYTTTKTWKKDEVTPPSDFYVGQVLYTSKAFATSAEANTHMWEISTEWFDFGYANNIAVKPSAFGGGGKYYVTVTVESLNVN